jgi:hypothetical protein
MISHSRASVSLLLGILWLLLLGAAPPERHHEPRGATAKFEGATLDLAVSWGDAEACLVWRERVSVAECFRTEAQMDARIAQVERISHDAGASTLDSAEASATSSSECSGYLRLYDGTSYSGTILYLRSRYQWHNLADYGFDQRTSSYKIGPCSAYLADYVNGGGDWYPTYLTQAYDQAASMLSGWNNDVSSVYIT